MTGWESLRVDLRRLRQESPDALVVFPDPESERSHEQRISIDLAAWATDVAATLDAKYGSFVDLRVGAMSFPSRKLVRVRAGTSYEEPSLNRLGSE